MSLSSSNLASEFAQEMRPEHPAADIPAAKIRYAEVLSTSGANSVIQMSGETGTIPNIKRLCPAAAIPNNTQVVMLLFGSDMLILGPQIST